MCGSAAWALTQVGGVYQIGTAQELAEFAALVNGGERMANAVITADIDYSGQTEMIGTEKNRFFGTLDGQGHTVTINLVASGKNTALVAYLSGTVRNLHVSGNIKTDFQHVGGVVGTSIGGIVYNCYSDVNMTTSVSGDATCGGILALSNTATVVANCVYSGTISGSLATNCGGIVGWALDATTIQNCLFVGDMDIVMNTRSSAI